MTENKLVFVSYARDLLAPPTPPPQHPKPDRHQHPGRRLRDRRQKPALSHSVVVDAELVEHAIPMLTHEFGRART